jgi:hypothetical protein
MITCPLWLSQFTSSYDVTRRAVRFWGYDRSMESSFVTESSFVVTTDALKQFQPNLPPDPVDLLRAFDINRDRTYATTAKVYARGRKGSYQLDSADFLPGIRRPWHAQWRDRSTLLFLAAGSFE